MFTSSRSSVVIGGAVFIVTIGALGCSTEETMDFRSFTLFSFERLPGQSGYCLEATDFLSAKIVNAGDSYEVSFVTCGLAGDHCAEGSGGGEVVSLGPRELSAEEAARVLDTFACVGIERAALDALSFACLVGEGVCRSVTAWDGSEYALTPVTMDTRCGAFALFVDKHSSQRIRVLLEYLRSNTPG